MSNVAITRMEDEVSRLEKDFESFSSWPAEILMMACLREMDQLFMGWKFSVREPSQLERRILQSGYAAVHRLYPCASFERGTPLFEQTDDIRSAAYSCLLCAANIADLQSFLRLQRAGLIRLEADSFDHIRLIMLSRHGVELREQRLAQAFWRSVAPEVERRLLGELGPISTKKLNRELAKVVRPWEKHFIGYGSTPYLDSCFAQIAAPMVASNPLWNFLPPNTQLGASLFSEFQMAAGALTAFALKHDHCVIALLNKNPSAKLINLVAIASDTSSLAESLAEACNFDRDKACEILKTFTLERGETSYEYEPNLYFPPLLETSAFQVVRTSFGILADPFAFMMRKVARLYPSDWDKAMNVVEADFRADLHKLFEGDRYFCIPGAVKIRVGGRVVTDVDAAVFDRLSGTLGLYQLKWQLPHWGSFRERMSKGRNFLSTGHSWIDVLGGALPRIGLAEIQTAFRIPAKIGRVTQITGFVLGRFFSEFGEVDPERNDGVTWGSWPQFAIARARLNDVTDTQAAIAEALRQMHGSPTVDESIDETFGDLRVSWSPES